MSLRPSHRHLSSCSHSHTASSSLMSRLSPLLLLSLSLLLLSFPTLLLCDVPILNPTPTVASASAPRELTPSPSESLPQIVVPLTPEERSAGLYKYDESFPSEPPKKPNVNYEPLPLSSPGRYLHTSVVIKNKMYVFGGLASYEKDKFFNDMWLFNVGNHEWSQLQSSYVPPLPKFAGVGRRDVAAFTPKDVPQSPAMENAPKGEPDRKVEPLLPNANQPNPFLPRRRSQRPIRVLKLAPLLRADETARASASKKGAAPHPALIEQEPDIVNSAAYQDNARDIDAQDSAEQSQLEQDPSIIELARAQHISPALLAQLTRQAQAKSDAHTTFLQQEEQLTLAHRTRSRSRRATPRFLQMGSELRNTPGDARGTSYAESHLSPPTSVQKHAPNVDPDTREGFKNDKHIPHALIDLWEYDIDNHEWNIVNISSSVPLSHSPWLSPQHLKDPIFKDPLPSLLPPTRRLHSAVVMHNRMVIFGGVSYNNLVLGDVWVFDPSDRTWMEANADGPLGSPILPREGHTAIVAKDQLEMFVFGGVSYGFFPFNDLWVYSAENNRWNRLKPEGTLPMSRWLHTAVYHEGSHTMVVFGGVTAHYVPLNDVHVYDIAQNQWSEKQTVGVPPFPRMMHTAVTLKDVMIVQGGAANNLPMDDLWLLDFNTWRWRELLPTGGYPFARTGATAVLLSPKSVWEQLPEDERTTLSEDKHDPHLQWKVDHDKFNERPVVGSFSNEGLDNGAEHDADTTGLYEIAFPKTAVLKDAPQQTVRPMFRYRKHSENNFYIIVFGGATATSTPQDEAAPAAEAI